MRPSPMALLQEARSRSNSVVRSSWAMIVALGVIPASGTLTVSLPVPNLRFNVQALGKIYRHIDPEFNKLRKKFKALEDGIGKGSGRSVRGVQLGPAIIAAHCCVLIAPVPESVRRSIMTSRARSPRTRRRSAAGR